MKITFIILVCLAVVLGIIAYFAVFSGTQVIEPTANSNDQQSSTSTMVLTTPSSSTSTVAVASTTGQTFTASFSAPYPVTWQEGQTQLAVTGASLRGGQLTLTVNLQLGSSTQCVPIDLRMVMDEAGDLAAPSSPATANFPLAPDGSCNVAAGGQYVSNIGFAIDPASAPFLFTTGAPSNIFFEVATTTGNGLQVMIPQQSG